MPSQYTEHACILHSTNRQKNDYSYDMSLWWLDFNIAKLKTHHNTTTVLPVIKMRKKVTKIKLIIFYYLQGQSNKTIRFFHSHALYLYNLQAVKKITNTCNFAMQISLTQKNFYSLLPFFVFEMCDLKIESDIKSSYLHWPLLIFHFYNLAKGSFAKSIHDLICKAHKTTGSKLA